MAIILGLVSAQEPVQPKAEPAAAKPRAATASPNAAAKPPSLFPEGYLDGDRLADALEKAAAEAPARVRLESLAKTLQGRDVWLVTLSEPGQTPAAVDPASAPRPKRPAVLIVANLEADHVVGSQVALGLIQKIAADAVWADLLARSTIYVVPRLNPDGAERFLRSPRGDLKTNLRPVDRDRDGKTGEDGPDDLNGDALISAMRVKDARATLIPDPKEPRLLRRAEMAKGERPVYSEYLEGIDNDGDGLINEDPLGGVNLNRNWPQRWTEFDAETGFSPASEPETHALIQFVFDHPEINVIWSFGLNDNLAVAPKKPESTYDEADIPLLAELSRLHGKALDDLKKPTPAEEPAKPATEPSKPDASRPPTVAVPAAPGATTDGSLSEWAYHQGGVIGLASRLWQGPELLEPAKDMEPARAKDENAKPAASAIPAEADGKWLYWNDHVMGGRAFVPFAEFDHPTLGKVELGGWKPGVRINPPIEDVETITRAEHAFLGELLKRLPRLAIADVKVQAKGGGIFQITAGVVNEGEFPTAITQGVRARRMSPVQVRFDAGAGRLLAGPARARIDSLGGLGGREEYRWLVQAPANAAGNANGPAVVTLRASSPRTGEAVKTISLEESK